MKRGRNPIPQIRYISSGEVRVFTVELAAVLGLNEAIIIQQLCYWLERTPHHINGRYWVYNSYEEWQRQFPWWSVPTIKRVFLRLEEAGLIQSGQFNQLKIDRTKWYTIDFERLANMIAVWDRLNSLPEAESDTARVGGEPVSSGVLPVADSPLGQSVRPMDQNDPIESGSVRSHGRISQRHSGSEITYRRPTQRDAVLPEVRRDDAHAATTPTPPLRYTASQGDQIPYLLLADLCRHPQPGETVQDQATLHWWRYEGRGKGGFWVRLADSWQSP